MILSSLAIGGKIHASVLNYIFVFQSLPPSLSLFFSLGMSFGPFSYRSLFLTLLRNSLSLVSLIVLCYFIHCTQYIWINSANGT